MCDIYNCRDCGREFRYILCSAILEDSNYSSLHRTFLKYGQCLDCVNKEKERESDKKLK